MFQKPCSANLKVLLFKCASSLIQLGLHQLNYEMSVWILLPFDSESGASTSKNMNIDTYLCSMHVYIYMNKSWYFTKTYKKHVMCVLSPHYLRIPYLRICLLATTFLSPPHQYSRCSPSNLQTCAEWWHIWGAWTGMLPAEMQQGNSSALCRLSRGGDRRTGMVG